MLGQLAERKETRSLDGRALDPVLHRMLREKPFLANLFLCDAAGVVLASAAPGYVGRDASHRKYLRDALTAADLSCGQYAVSAVTGQPVLHSSWPVRDPDGKIAGVLVAALDLTRYGQTFDRLELPPGGFLEVLDDQGVRLWRTPEAQDSIVGRPLDAAVVHKLLGTQHADLVQFPAQALRDRTVLRLS